MKMKNKTFLFLVLYLFLLVYNAGTNETNKVINKYVSISFNASPKETNTSSTIEKLNASTLRILANKIHEHYEKLFQHKAFNGCVLVAIEDKIIYENAWGYSDIRQKQCLNTNSIFQLASVSKVFTAVAVLKLYEQNKLQLTDLVTKYIPDFPYKDVGIHHLLNHTAGLPNYLHLMPEIGRQDTILSHWSVMDFLIRKKLRQEFKTGKRHKYCNTNYAVLACLIEKISGMSYSDFLKKEIFIPLNMNQTNTIHYVDIFDENTTTSHEYKSRAVPFYAGDFILGDKSIYSSIHDLFQFSQAFLNGKVLKDSTIRLMTQGIKTNRYGMLYGYGIRIKHNEDTDKTIWFHNGWWHGYRTSFQMRPKDKVTVIVLSNHIHKTTYFTHPIFQTIDEILYQENTDNSNSEEKNSTHTVYPKLDDEE
jgi:CubicO group peptidase (beta-lactamase class C family)